MKRVNIHFNEDWLKELDKILEKLRKQEDNRFWIWSVTRADLIRLAISKFYGLTYHYIHAHEDSLLDSLKILKILKK